jgi:O6-methylguanine-DNA--protein-cysteine methyltransferase
MSDDGNVIGRLSEMLGFNAASKPESGIAGSILSALDDIKKERTEKAKEAAKALILQALTEAEGLDKLKKDFDAAFNKRNKALQKLVNRIQAYFAGKEPEPEKPDNEPDKPESDNS